MWTRTQCPATPPPPQNPQSTIAEPHVSVGINRSAPSSSHPALKSFPEVVLQKPAAEEDKRAAIPQAQRLLSSTQLSLFAAPPPHLLLFLHYSLIPSSLPSLLVSVPLLFLHNLPFSLHESIPSFSPRPSQCCNSVFCASLSVCYFVNILSIFCQYFAFCGTCV